MFKFELLKLFKEKLLWISLAALMVFNSLFIRVTFFVVDDSQAMRAKAACFGEINSNNVSAVLERKNSLEDKVLNGVFSTEYDETLYTGYEFSEYWTFNEIFQEMKRRYEYGEVMEKKASICLENAEYYKKRNTGLYKFNLKLAKNFSGRKITEYYDTRNLELFLNYDVGVVCALAFMMVAMTLSFDRERRKNTAGIIGSCVETLNGICVIKIFVCIFVTIVGYLAIETATAVSFGIIDYPRQLLLPLYSINGFEMTYTNDSIMGFIVKRFFVRSLAVIDIGAVFFVLIKFIKNRYLLLVAMLSTCVAMIGFARVSAMGFNPVVGLGITNLVRESRNTELLGMKFLGARTIVIGMVVESTFLFGVAMLYGKLGSNRKCF
ncbi:MAG: hypothetical protein IK018_10520 [Lachnospiraceae bacterium]|nr:hypothetical protein [Lachnospiraceae bacterium]